MKKLNNRSSRNSRDASVNCLKTKLLHIFIHETMVSVQCSRPKKKITHRQWSP